MDARDDFREFYSGSYSRIVGQLFVLTHDLQEAEDLAQEAFARASVRWRRIRTYGAPEAWVRRVAFNLAADQRRRSLRRVRALTRMEPPPDVPAVDAQSVDLARTLARVPLRSRQVLVLHYVADVPLEEIAGQLGVPLGTVKSRLARGRETLARHFDLDREALRRAGSPPVA
jgi:RNA polymerase sigma-70 factor (ECF subfamily)